MKIQYFSTFKLNEQIELLVLPFWKEKKAHAAFHIDQCPFHFQHVLNLQDFSGKENSTLLLYPENSNVRRVLLVGLGEKECISHERLRRAYGAVINDIKAASVEQIDLIFPTIEMFDPVHVFQSMYEGLFISNYAFNTLKGAQDKEKQPVQTAIFHGLLNEVVESNIIERMQKIQYWHTFCRDLVNNNADNITPEYIGEITKEIGSRFASIRVDVHTKDWIEKQKMGLLAAVARESYNTPRFITIQYNGNPLSIDRTVLVGKGVTYDTGGLYLKPSAGGSMDEMKADMAGAAAVIAATFLAADLQLSINITAVIPACENAIGGNAYKPGDVYRSLSGKTVEIGNTDAEGRLILADAITYAVKHFSPNRIIDIATLTGGIDVALGREYFGLFSNSDALAEELLHSSLKTYERGWRMPLPEEYMERLKSDVADIRNIAKNRSASPVIGAMFIKAFVPDHIPWAHLDIAPCAYIQEKKSYYCKGATGVGVRLFIDYFEHLAKKK